MEDCLLMIYDVLNLHVGIFGGQSLSGKFCEKFVILKTSVSKNVMLVCDTLYSNSIESCCSFESLKHSVCCSLALVHIENVSQIITMKKILGRIYINNMYTYLYIYNINKEQFSK